MKIKVLINFDDEKSYEVVKYLFEYHKTHNLDVEFLGLDLDSNTNDFENVKVGGNDKAYYGIYYANRVGVSLEMTKKLFDKKYLEDADLNDMKVIADSFKEIGFNRDDMIDALIDGNYQQTHIYMQKKHHDEGYSLAPVCLEGSNGKCLAQSIEELKLILK
ncbi:MAG: hypothetical protein ACRCTA_05825 [Bacilli bacterium]